MKEKKDFRLSEKTYSSLWLCVLGGILFLTAFTILIILDLPHPDYYGIGFIAVYCVLIVIAAVFSRRHAIEKKNRHRDTAALSTVMAETVKKLDLPFVVTDQQDTIIWFNAGFAATVGKKSLYGESIGDYCRISPRDIAEVTMAPLPEALDESDRAEAGSDTVIEVRGRTFDVSSYRIHVTGKIYYLTVFDDTTDLCALKKQQEREAPVVAYVVLDNLDEMSQYLRVSSREAANRAETVLKEWAESLNALIREYDRDKYVLVFNREKMLACVADKFDILEKIRNIRLGDSSMPITVSMGVCCVGDTMEQRDAGAQSALDMALQRGGDQVAVRSENGLDFFGGRTRNVQKRTRVLARVISNQLLDLIAGASNVVIMGHRFPDFDSVGSCVGLARLCMHCGITPRIVVDENNENFKNCAEALLATDTYRDVFISATGARSLMSEGTLLIIADANNMDILESPSLAHEAEKVVIIDHHRKTAEFVHPPLLSYIDPSASSACELVAEILEQCLPEGSMTKEESTVMLSGVMVDTKDFTRGTGTRTFAAALYLRGEGGDSEVAHTYFDEELRDFSAEAKFGTNVTIYRDFIAITTSPGTGSDSDRTAASKVADKLLSVRRVEAAFALVQLGNSIHISARSTGSVNVQLILEKLNGGGHFSIAGALVASTNMKETLVRLKAAIDEYLDNL